MVDDTLLFFDSFASKRPNFPNFTNYTQYTAICHTFFIVKDKNVKINWKKPLIQNSQIKTTIQIHNKPFSQGAMRYAFYALDTTLNQKLVAKLPKSLTSYNIPTLQKDLESIFICQHIVNEFNEKIVLVSDEKTNILFDFIHCFIYELADA